MRLLLHNPNSNEQLTRNLGRAIAPLLHSNESLQLSTAEQGPAFIGSDEAIDAARAALVDQLDARSANCDAIVLGCFGDLGITDLKRSVAKPILSLWDACAAAAVEGGKRYGIVTTSAFWCARLARDIRDRGLSSSIPTVRAISGSPSASPDKLGASISRVLDELAAESDLDAAVLGGALLAALRPVPAGPIPMFDTLAAAVRLCRVCLEKPHC